MHLFAPLPSLTPPNAPTLRLETQPQPQPPKNTVKGYAWSGGGRDIIRVDVSTDGGKTWAAADLTKPPTNASGRAWAMTLYTATLPLPKGASKPGAVVDVVCKATDEAYNTQPESPSAIWNVRGLANNSWHRVAVKVTE